MDYENVMNEETVMTTENEVIETEKSGLGAVAILAIGAVGAAVIGAAATFGKKLWNKHKAHTELRQPDPEEPVELTDEDIAAVIE